MKSKTVLSQVPQDRKYDHLHGHGDQHCPGTAQEHQERPEAAEQGLDRRRLKRIDHPKTQGL